MSKIGCGPTWRIDGPPPQAPLYTLIGASRIVDDLDSREAIRWGNGVEVYPYTAGPAHAWDPGATGSSRVKVGAAEVEFPTFSAFGVYITGSCIASGIWGAGMTEEEAQTRFVQRITATMAAIESQAVEREFLAGDMIGLNPHLADGNGDFPFGNTATSVLNGFALLENAIARDGRRGIIHCAPATATAAVGMHLVERDDRDGVLRTTAKGTVVVPGDGYVDGPTPAGGSHSPTTLTHEWAYATGPVDIRRSEIVTMPETVSGALDRSTNKIEFRAERYYVVDWDTVVQTAVLIDRCTDSCGSAP